GDEFLISRAKALWRHHHAVLQPRALAVAGGVQRRELAGGELATLDKDRAHQVWRQLGEIRQRHEPRQIGEFLDAKGDVGYRWAIVRDRRNLGDERAAFHLDQATSMGSGALICTGSRRSLFR